MAPEFGIVFCSEIEFIIPKSAGGLTRREHDALCCPAAFATNAPLGNADLGRGPIVVTMKNKSTSTAELPAPPSQMPAGRREIADQVRDANV
jgi:hypothetical protein